MTDLKVINRGNEKTVIFKRSKVPLLIIQLQLIFSLLGLGVTLVFIFALLFNIPEFLMIIVLIYLVLALLVFLGYSLRYLYYRSVKYTLIPGYVQKSEDQIIDQIPDKVVIESGLLSKRIQTLTLNELDRVEVFKSFLGKYFNYGNVHLEQVDKLTQTADYVLRNVLYPESAMNLIQKQIDIEITPSQPI